MTHLERRFGAFTARAQVNGRKTVALTIEGPGGEPYTDRVDLVSLPAREALVQSFPAEWHTDVRPVLEGLAADIARLAPVADATPGSAVAPWADPVDGAAWLLRVRDLLTAYVVLPEGAADFLAAFALVTWCLDAFTVAPYVAVLSPTPECGKTRLLEVLQLVVCRPWPPALLTGPVLFRGIEAKRPTLLVDEAEVVSGKGETADNVRALLHAGYRRGVTVARCVGEQHELKEFDVFGPKVFAAIGELPRTLFTRCVSVPMRRRASSEPVAPFSWDAMQPAARELQAQALRFAADTIPVLKASTVEAPGFLSDRQREVWGPLCRVAEAVGHGWPQRLEAAAQALTVARSEGLGETLLRDLRAAFEGHERFASAALVITLNALESSPWGDLNGGKGLSTNQLARRLKPFDVVPGKWREGSETVRGYAREAFADAWARYLAPVAVGVAPQPPGVAVDPPRDTPGGTGIVASVAVVAGSQGCLPENMGDAYEDDL